MGAQDIIKDMPKVDITAPFPFNIDSALSHILFYVISITVMIGCVFLCILLIKGIIKQFKSGFDTQSDRHSLSLPVNIH